MTRWAFEAGPPPDELTTIRVFANQTELLIARSALESAGIECFAREEHGMRIDNLGPAIGMALQVRSCDAEDARAILDAPPLAESSDVEG